MLQNGKRDIVLPKSGMFSDKLEAKLMSCQLYKCITHLCEECNR